MKYKPPIENRFVPGSVAEVRQDLARLERETERISAQIVILKSHVAQLVAQPQVNDDTPDVDLRIVGRVNANPEAGNNLRT